MSPERILIFTIAGDLHAFAVAQALRHKGAQVDVWLTSAFPAGQLESFRCGPSGESLGIRYGSTILNDPDPRTVWNRRIGFGGAPPCLDPADRPFAEIQSRRFREGILYGWAPGAFWVNPWDSTLRAESKILQQQIALSIDLVVPDTLYSNDPKIIRDFVREHGGRVAYKAFAAAGWAEDGKVFGCHTAAIGEHDLVADPLLEAVPGIYQEVVPKLAELRVTVMGNHIFAARIASQETKLGTLDWRRAYSEIRMEREELPGQVQEKCYALMRELGIVFGCFDFIVTPANEFVFLEVNCQGQFLFVEQYTGLPLLDAFTDFLLSGSRDFRYMASVPRVGYDRVVETARHDAERSLAATSLSTRARTAGRTKRPAGEGLCEPR